MLYAQAWDSATIAKGKTVQSNFTNRLSSVLSDYTRRVKHPPIRNPYSRDFVNQCKDFGCAVVTRHTEPSIAWEDYKVISDNEKAMILGDRRSRIGPLTTDYPGSLPLSNKLRGTEMTRRMRQLAINLQGAEGALYVGDDEARQGGFWQRAYFNSFSATIGGGTSQVQANIVAEHVLGLPK